jgi:hypothetical protein
LIWHVATKSFAGVENVISRGVSGLWNALQNLENAKYSQCSCRVRILARHDLGSASSEIHDVAKCRRHHLIQGGGDSSIPSSMPQSFSVSAGIFRATSLAVDDASKSTPLKARCIRLAHACSYASFSFDPVNPSVAAATRLHSFSVCRRSFLVSSCMISRRSSNVGAFSS